MVPVSATPPLLVTDMVGNREGTMKMSKFEQLVRMVRQEQLPITIGENDAVVAEPARMPLIAK